MKRIVRLTESDLTRIVRRVIMEQEIPQEFIISVDNVYNQIVSMFNSTQGMRTQEELNDIKNSLLPFLKNYFDKLKKGEGSFGDTYSNKWDILSTMLYQSQKGRTLYNPKYQFKNAMVSVDSSLNNQNQNNRYPSATSKLNRITEELKNLRFKTL